MNLPEPQGRTFSSLMSDIEKGQIKIPQFQRDFVWNIKKSASLIDSIIKGYPIGSFIFWKTKERLRSIREIGGLSLPEPDDGDSVDYVLDGQQRLTSIYACLKGLSIERGVGSNSDDFSCIFINLESKGDEMVVTTEVSDFSDGSYISVLDLLSGDFRKLSSYDKKFHENINLYKNRIESYQYSIVVVKDAPIEIATEIFTRINVGGKSLSLFEIMVAKTFDYESGFDLSEKFDELIERIRPHDYETISDATILQVVSIIVTKECKRQTILNMKKKTFIEVWDSSVDAVERAVEYFKNYFRIPVSQLLPYNALLVPFAYFFYHHNDKPTDEKRKYLEDFFWRCSLAGRYSSSVESKLAQDVRRIDLILNGKLPDYDWSIDSSSGFIEENGWFSAGRSYVKAILCIYAYQQPKSFNDDSIVSIGNYWLKQANSKNYHHFFPKAFLRKKGVDDFYVNHILNITIVDDFLNKREIGAKAPSQYMEKFRKSNPNLDSTMNSHLIGGLEDFGIWDDDYDRFFKERANIVSREIKKRIIKQEIDKLSQPELYNHSEE